LPENEATKRTFINQTYPIHANVIDLTEILITHQYQIMIFDQKKSHKKTLFTLAEVSRLQSCLSMIAVIGDKISQILSATDR